MLKKSGSLSCSYGLFGLSGPSSLFGLSGLSGFLVEQTNQMNQINQINKTNQINSSRVPKWFFRSLLTLFGRSGYQVYGIKINAYPLR